MLIVSVCTYSTTEQVGMYAPGLTQQGAVGRYTEASCVAACSQSAICYSCDYNTQSQICWFGSTQNPPTAPNPSVNHYDLSKTCSVGMSGARVLQ